MIPMRDDVGRAAGDNGVKELVVGMGHRGRLNVLVNILGKPPKTLFDEFEGKFEHPDDPAHSGDVKYHMGFSADVKTPKGGVHVALARSEEHTSELQSLMRISYAVFCLKKKTQVYT